MSIVDKEYQLNDQFETIRITKKELQLIELSTTSSTLILSIWYLELLELLVVKWMTINDIMMINL